MADITPARAAELIAEALQHSADACKDRRAVADSVGSPEWAAGYAAKAAEFQQLHDTLARTLPGASGLRRMAGPGGPAIVSPSQIEGEPDIDVTDMAAEALAGQLASDRAKDARTFNSAAAAVLKRSDGTYAVTTYPVRDPGELRSELRSVHYPGGQLVRMMPDLTFSDPDPATEPGTAAFLAQRQYAADDPANYSYHEHAEAEPS